MRWIRAAAAAAVTATIVVAPAPAHAAEGVVRGTSVGGGAQWGWHKVAHLPDGTRTFRTGYFVAGWADLRQGGETWTEQTVYAHAEDYTYRADASFVSRVNRLFAGSSDTLTWTIAPDYSTARVTGTMVETVCDQWYEVCTEVGAVGIDLRFAAANLQVYSNETFRPTRYQGSFSHLYSGASTYQTPAYGDIGAMSFPVTYAAAYSVFDGIGKTNCRNTCWMWEPTE